MSPTPPKKKGRGGDRSAIARAKGKAVGRPKKPIVELPETADNTFAARVLAKVGSEKWQELHAAIQGYELHGKGWNAHDFKDHLEAIAEKDKAAAAALEAKLEPLLTPPPHPKELIDSDETLMLYYMLCGDRAIERKTAWDLIEKRDGKAMHTVNHLHDKPIEHSVTLDLAERFRIAIEKGKARVASLDR